MKEINVQQLTFSDKVWIFLKRDAWSIVASSIALFTWWQEKVTLEEHKTKLSEYYRFSNTAGLMLTDIRLCEIETNMTLLNKKTFINDSAFEMNFFKNVINEVKQEHECLFAYEVERDAGENIVTTHRLERNSKDLQLQRIMNTANFDTIYNYKEQEKKAFGEELHQLQNTLTPTLAKIKDTLRQKLNLYLLCYLIAGTLFTIDRIVKVK